MVKWINSTETNHFSNKKHQQQRRQNTRVQNKSISIKNSGLKCCLFGKKSDAGSILVRVSNFRQIRYYVWWCLWLAASWWFFLLGEAGMIRQTQNGNVDLIPIEAIFGVNPTPTWATDRPSHVRFSSNIENQPADNARFSETKKSTGCSLPECRFSSTILLFSTF